jgi:2-polyprenyl-3-methyl-5-hydroxy-6-metoxy-1,4-benzoquinol methylase
MFGLIDWINYSRKFMTKFIVETKHPIAFDSPDHLNPLGTKNDNLTCIPFISDLEGTFGNRFHVMDLGCAGGLLVHDFVRRGHIALGLEGSDYNIQNHSGEWPVLYQKNLFTCDISRKYSVFIDENGEKMPFLCDVISAWEVVEHIPPERLGVFFENIRKHLRIGGQFFGSISINPCICNGCTYHQSLFSKDVWQYNLLQKLNGLMFKEYPYLSVMRREVVIGNSFMVVLERTH